MVESIKRVAVTGGAGQIAYSLLFRIASGELFGSNQPVALHILEIPASLGALEGVVMELHDCAYPLLHDVVIGSDPYTVFANVDYAFLVGAKPRSKGMERADLLQENAKIFVEQGKALNEVAAADVLVLVVGNPCNTNAWITMKHAPRIPRAHFHAMTRLDQNRAMAQLALKADVSVEAVAGMTIWGNHSSTQVPDFINAKIQGRPAIEVIGDRSWLEGPFIEMVQKRGSAIITARGRSSAASAANAALGAMKALACPDGAIFSSGRCSDGNSYGIADDLIFSFPCVSKEEIVKEIPWDDFLKERIAETERELLAERDAVAHL